MRYFFEISYNGSNYHGWQNQKNAIGVQHVVENALSKLLRSEIEIVGSGRTDTGVHCVQQFFHADIEKEFKISDLLHRLNAFLPQDIAIKNILHVKDDAHARYDAIQRSYIYKITQTKDPLLVGFAHYFFRELNVPVMEQAASMLLGERDFECFSKVHTDVNHFRCEVTQAMWQRKGDLLIFTISANRFLRGMVRAIVGTLLDVGIGKISVKQFEEILLSKDRKKAGMNAPPEGLYLTAVTYRKAIFK
jgi:tRNA pseudouridine38-40 synthase